MTGLSFRETMRGWVAFGERDYAQGLVRGRREGTCMVMRLVVEIDDVDRFTRDASHPARVLGAVHCDALGGRLEVEDGLFNLHVDLGDRRHKHMRYRMRVRDPDGRPLTVAGFKLLQDDPNHDVWTDTASLFTTVASGHGDDPDSTLASGICFVRRLDFLRQLTTFRASGGPIGARVAAHLKFNRFFVRGLLQVFGGATTGGESPDFPSADPSQALRYRGRPPGTWHPVGGHSPLERRILGVRTADGQEITLHHLRRPGATAPPPKGPVLLVHGTGVRGDIFYTAPRSRLCDALVDAGYDPWVANWRASIDLPASDYTLDDGAIHDHPACVRRVLEETGARTLKAVVHCQGSTSFTMAAVAGLLPEVTTVVSNAVSLHVDVTPGSRLKQTVLLPPTRRLISGLDAQWAVRPPAPFAAALARYARLVRGRDCDEPICQMANYMYGTGPDVLWRHANLDPETHFWVGREFGWTPLSFFDQMRRSVLAGHLVPVTGGHALPDSLVAAPPRTGARFVLLAGGQNRTFLPSGQRRTFTWLDTHRPGFHAYREIAGYGHLDMMFGEHAARDVHPHIVAALDESP